MVDLPSEPPVLPEEDLPFTGERFVPSERGEIAYEHYHRYAAVGEAARNKVVLDIACGEGFGSALLARTAAEVIGIDIDQQSIAHAARTYREGNLKFLCGDCRALTLPTGSIDLIVSFETIEHVREHELVLNEFLRVLRPLGSLVISSPDKVHYRTSPSAHNRFHLRELTHQQFVRLLSKHFPFVEMYRQRVAIASFLFADHSERGRTLSAFMTGERGSQSGFGSLRDCTYSLAVCARQKQELVVLGSSVHLDPEDDLLIEQKRVMQWAATLHEEHERERRTLSNSLELIQGELKQLRTAIENGTAQQTLELARLRSEMEKKILDVARGGRAEKQ